MSNKTISPGLYTIADIFALADFDFKTKSATSQNDGQPDYRRVTVGNLPFSNLDEVVNVPSTATELVIALDGEPDTVLTVS